MTNREKLRQMSDVELGAMLCHWMEECPSCPANDMCGMAPDGMIEWLRKEDDRGQEPMRYRNMMGVDYTCDTCKHNDRHWSEEPCVGCCRVHSGYEPAKDGEE